MIGDVIVLRHDPEIQSQSLMETCCIDHICPAEVDPFRRMIFTTKCLSLFLKQILVDICIFFVLSLQPRVFLLRQSSLLDGFLAVRLKLKGRFSFFFFLEVKNNFYFTCHDFKVRSTSLRCPLDAGGLLLSIESWE